MRYELTPQYLDTLALVRRLITRARIAGNAHDIRLLEGMRDDLSWTIVYMETGDDSYRRYSRCIPVDPQVLGEWIDHTRTHTPIRNADSARSDLLLVLDELSDREQEAYLLVQGEGFSRAGAARLMGVGKSTVQEYIRRAREKIAACRTKSTTSEGVFKQWSG